MIHTNSPEEKWNVQKAKLKTIYANLSDSDFLFDYGEKEVMMMKLQGKLGVDRPSLDKLLAELDNM
jgi:hypothetical protein